MEAVVKFICHSDVHYSNFNFVFHFFANMCEILSLKFYSNIYCCAPFRLLVNFQLLLQNEGMEGDIQFYFYTKINRFVTVF